MTISVGVFVGVGSGVGVSVAVGGSVGASVVSSAGGGVGGGGGGVVPTGGGRVGVNVAVETVGGGVTVGGEARAIIVGVGVGCPSWLAKKTAATIVRITTMRTPAPITRRCIGEVVSFSLDSIDTINSPCPERYVYLLTLGRQIKRWDFDG